MPRPAPNRRDDHPLLLRWQARGHPLPVRAIKATGPRPRMSPGAGPPWLAGAGPQPPLDFCAAVRRLIADVARRCPEFAHVDAERVLVSVTQARSARPHGLQARVTPLRFGGGALTRKRRGATYHVQRFFLDQTEFLYVLTFCLPRYLEQTFDQKFITLFHELYHIHPDFNGDLRRHPGRYQFHTSCQRAYDREMVGLAREYLARQPDPALSDFLRLDFAQLLARHGTVTGVVVPRPKIIPLVGRLACAANFTPKPEAP